MNFKFNEQQRILRDSVHRFFKKECTREYIRQCSDDYRFPIELYEKMAKQGWMGIIFPEKYGGAGLSAIELAIFLEEAGYAWYAAGIAYCTSVINGGNIILTYGTERQKEQYLPQLIKGKYKFAFALSEPNVGSDAASVELFAGEAGDYFVLNGTKMFVTNAHVADYLVTIARTKRHVKNKHDGITIFLVNSKSEGITIKPLKQLGRTATHTNEVIYEDVKVPIENVIGNVDYGWKILNEGLGLERVAAGIMYAGICQSIINYTMDYAKKRVQFGKQICKFQAIRHKFAEMQMRADASRLLAYRVAWMFKEGLPCFKEMSIAKLYSAESMFYIANEGVQIMGGYGVLHEFDMERFFRDARIGLISGGSSEIQKTIIAKEMGL